MLALLGCTAEIPRELEVVQAEADAPARDSWAGDSGASTTLTSAQALPVHSSCGDPEAAPWEGEDAAEVAWCARVSPEALAPEGPPPPPCGFSNLVGSVGLDAGPALLYCDADPDGGVRLVTFDGAGGFQSSLLQAADCEAAQHTGDLVATEDGWLVAWSGYATGTRDSPDSTGLLVARVAADGSLLEGPERSSIEGSGLWRVNLLDAGTALFNDLQGSAWLARLEDLSIADTEAVEAGFSDAERIEVGDRELLARCSYGENLLSLAERVDGDWVELGPSGACTWETRPSLATDGETLAMAWDDDDGTTLGFLRGESWTEARVAEDVFAPQVVWTGASFVLLTGDGALRSYDPDGIETDLRWHPGLVQPSGSVSATRLAAGAGTLYVSLMGLDAVPLAGGHAITYNYLEVSALPWP